MPDKFYLHARMDNEELLHLLALKKSLRVGDTLAKKLLREFGSAVEVFKQKPHVLEKIEGIGKIRSKGLKDNKLFEKAESELKYILDNSIEFDYFMDEGYPERLKYCVDGPIILFRRGKIDLSGPHILSIVGTRKLTTYGSGFLEELISSLQPLNPVIVSGYAYGTDIKAHQLAIEHGLQTVAVMAHGLNQTYPKVHKKFNAAMEKNGGFMTDFWSQDTFDRNNFLGRNRVIAGISEATVVIESAEKGGSLVTAQLANGYNREVFALPGRVTDSQSVGCNNLIKQSAAHAITIPADIPYILGWKAQEQKAVQKQLFVDLNDKEKKVFRLLKDRDKELLDIIALETGIPVHEMAGLLMSMELKGVIMPLPGKLFRLA